MDHMLQTEPLQSTDKKFTYMQQFFPNLLRQGADSPNPVLSIVVCNGYWLQTSQVFAGFILQMEN